MTINHEALANAGALAYEARAHLVRAIRPGELERYRDDIRAFIEAGRPGAQGHAPEVDVIISDPVFVVTTPALFRWMRDNHRGPWAPPPEQPVAGAGGFHVGDTVRYNDTVRLPLRGQARTVAAADDGSGSVRFTNGQWSWPDRLELVSCPHSEPQPASPQPVTTDGVQPIGPDHPGWPQFLAVTKEIAVEAGYCEEYEHMIERIEQRLRPATREQVTIEATVRLTLTVPTGDGPNPTEVITGHQWEGLSVTDWRYTERRPVRD